VSSGNVKILKKKSNSQCRREGRDFRLKDDADAISNLNLQVVVKIP